MQLGIGSYALAWSVGVPGHTPPRPLDAAGLVSMAADLGVHLVQICDNLPLDVLPDAELDRLARWAAERQVQIEVGTRGIRPEHLRRYLALAKRFASPILRVVIDTADHRPTLDETVATIRPVLPELHGAGITLAIENHDRFTARQFAQIVQQLESPAVGICLDTVNSFGALEGPVAVVTALAPWVVSLHVKEFCIRRADHQMGFIIEGRPAGQGRLNVPWLLEQLHAAGRQPNAILEQWPAPEATLEQTMAKEQAWLRQSVSYLRTLVTE